MTYRDKNDTDKTKDTDKTQMDKPGMAAEKVEAYTDKTMNKPGIAAEKVELAAKKAGAAKAKQFTCPSCGWSVTTPFGENDLTKHVTMHKENHHPDMKMADDKFKSMVKEVDIRMAPAEGNIAQKEETDTWKSQENVAKRY